MILKIIMFTDLNSLRQKEILNDLDCYLFLFLFVR